jgi:hypothetical protein
LNGSIGTYLPDTNAISALMRAHARMAFGGSVLASPRSTGATHPRHINYFHALHPTHPKIGPKARHRE